MLFSDYHRFAFVHIPKVGGTTVRRALGPYDSANNRFYGHTELPAQGQIDLAHMTLPTVAAHFPEEFDKLRRYWTFAMVREPSERFASSFYYWLRTKRRLSSTEVAAWTPDRLSREVDQLLETLAAQTGEYDPDLVHFTPQSLYIQNGTERIVDTLLPIERLNELLPQLLADRFGISVSFGHENRALAPPPMGPATSLLGRIASFLRNVKGARRILRRVERTYAPGNPLAADLLARPQVTEFVARHYADDFVVYRETLSALRDGAR